MWLYSSVVLVYCNGCAQLLYFYALYSATVTDHNKLNTKNGKKPQSLCKKSYKFCNLVGNYQCSLTIIPRCVGVFFNIGINILFLIS